MEFRVWSLALLLVLTVHAAAFVLLPDVTDANSGAINEGRDGVEIGLGKSGSYIDLLHVETTLASEPVQKHIEVEQIIAEELPQQQTIAKSALKVEAQPPSQQQTQYAVNQVETPAQEQTERDTPVENSEEPLPSTPRPEPVSQHNPAAVTADSAQAGRSQQQATGQGEDDSSGGKAGDARSYFSELMARLNQYKRYPAQAKKSKQQGIVRVHFTINKRGDVIERRLNKSSGHKLLDEAALAMFDAATPLPPIPEFMRRDSITLVLPVDFSLITNNDFKE